MSNDERIMILLHLLRNDGLLNSYLVLLIKDHLKIIKDTSFVDCRLKTV